MASLIWIALALLAWPLIERDVRTNRVSAPDFARKQVRLLLVGSWVLVLVSASAVVTLWLSGSPDGAVLAVLLTAGSVAMAFRMRSLRKQIG
ncbi:MAG: hypothetical protein PGN07_03630 [Aeromicrobium erythreum]